MKIKENILGPSKPQPPLMQPAPPREGRTTAFIRKRNDVSHQCSPPRRVDFKPNSPMRLPRLPPLQENRCPVSPYFGRSELLEVECPCFPSQLTEVSRPRGSVRPLAQYNRKPPAKIDLKRGSFSSKQMMRDAVNTTVETLPSESILVEETVKRKAARTPSPAVTTRSSRFQQISKQYKLDKSTLQQSLSEMSRRTHSTYASRSPVDAKQRMLTPPPEDLPWMKFVAALDHVTRINDYSGL